MGLSLQHFTFNKGWNGLAIEPHPKIYKVDFKPQLYLPEFRYPSEKDQNIQIYRWSSKYAQWFWLYDKRHDEEFLVK